MSPQECFRNVSGTLHPISGNEGSPRTVPTLVELVEIWNLLCIWFAIGPHDHLATWVEMRLVLRW